MNEENRQWCEICGKCVVDKEGIIINLENFFNDEDGHVFCSKGCSRAFFIGKNIESISDSIYRYLDHKGVL